MRSLSVSLGRAAGNKDGRGSTKPHCDRHDRVASRPAHCDNACAHWPSLFTCLTERGINAGSGHEVDCRFPTPPRPLSSGSDWTPWDWRHSRRWDRRPGWEPDERGRWPGAVPGRRKARTRRIVVDDGVDVVDPHWPSKRSYSATRWAAHRATDTGSDPGPG